MTAPRPLSSSGSVQTLAWSLGALAASSIVTGLAVMHLKRIPWTSASKEQVFRASLLVSFVFGSACLVTSQSDKSKSPSTPGSLVPIRIDTITSPPTRVDHLPSGPPINPPLLPVTLPAPPPSPVNNPPPKPVTLPAVAVPIQSVTVAPQPVEPADRDASSMNRETASTSTNPPTCQEIIPYRLPQEIVAPKALVDCAAALSPSPFDNLLWQRITGSRSLPRFLLAWECQPAPHRNIFEKLQLQEHRKFRGFWAGLLRSGPNSSQRGRKARTKSVTSVTVIASSSTSPSDLNSAQSPASKRSTAICPASSSSLAITTVPPNSPGATDSTDTHPIRSRSSTDAAPEKRPIQRREKSRLDIYLKEHLALRNKRPLGVQVNPTAESRKTVESGWVTSDYPDWKENQCKEVLKQVGYVLAEKFDGGASRINTERATAIIRQFDLGINTKYRQDLVDTIWLLYGPEQKNLHWSVRQDRLVALLNKINTTLYTIGNRDYETYWEARTSLMQGISPSNLKEDSARAQFLQIHLALTTANVMFTEVDLYDLAMGTFENVLEGRSKTGETHQFLDLVQRSRPMSACGINSWVEGFSDLASSDPSQSIGSEMETMLESIKKVRSKHGFDHFTRLGRKACAKIGKAAFTPLLQHNIPEFFWETDFLVNPETLKGKFGPSCKSLSRQLPPNRGCLHTVRQIRTPTPTADPGATSYMLSFLGGEGGKATVTGAFHLFIDSLAVEGKTFLYTNLQKPTGDELQRVTALKKFARAKRHTFFMLSFPMDGSYFTRLGKKPMALSALAEECEKAILGEHFTEEASEITTSQGYYFPLKAIKDRVRAVYGFDLQFGKVVKHCLKVNQEEFFEEFESKDVHLAAQQEFQMALNNRIEKILVALIRADVVCGTCKDAQDRAGSKGACKIYDTFVSLDVNTTSPAIVFTIMRFVAAAWFNKSEEVILDNRGAIAIRTNRRLERAAKKFFKHEGSYTRRENKLGKKRLLRDGVAEYDVRIRPRSAPK